MDELGFLLFCAIPLSVGTVAIAVRMQKKQLDEKAAKKFAVIMIIGLGVVVLIAGVIYDAIF